MSVPRGGLRVLPTARVGAYVLPAHGGNNRELAGTHQALPACFLHVCANWRLWGKGRMTSLCPHCAFFFFFSIFFSCKTQTGQSSRSISSREPSPSPVSCCSVRNRIFLEAWRQRVSLDYIISGSLSLSLFCSSLSPSLYPSLSPCALISLVH